MEDELWGEAAREYHRDRKRTRMLPSVTAGQPPAGALTWTSTADRNRKLVHWRRACLARYDKHCLAVAWVLHSWFNSKLGFAYGCNEAFANETARRGNKVPAALALMESDGGIIRVFTTGSDGRKRRLIYPGTAIMNTPATGVGHTPTTGVLRAPPSEGGP